MRQEGREQNERGGDGRRWAGGEGMEEGEMTGMERQ